MRSLRSLSCANLSLLLALLAGCGDSDTAGSPAGGAGDAGAAGAGQGGAAAGAGQGGTAGKSVGGAGSGGVSGGPAAGAGGAAGVSGASGQAGAGGAGAAGSGGAGSGGAGSGGAGSGGAGSGGAGSGGASSGAGGASGSSGQGGDSGASGEAGAAGQGGDGGSGAAGGGAGSGGGGESGSSGQGGGGQAGAGGASGQAGGGAGAGGASGGSGQSGGGQAGAGGASGSSGQAGAGGAPPGLVTVDFGVGSAKFPPTVNKIGFNSFWNSVSNDSNLDEWTIRRSAAHRAPMLGALIEPKSLVNVDGYEDGYEEYASDMTAADLDGQKCALWQQGSGFSKPLFVQEGNEVVARVPTDADLSAIRTVVRNRGLINFLQLSGTPGNTFPETKTMHSGLFALSGKPTTGGNWYPMPPEALLPGLARAFGTFPGAIGQETRTIFSFWQEPSHTIDEKLNAEESIALYSSFYWRVADEITQRCGVGACPVGGAQLNSNDGDFTPHTGQRYGLFTDGVRQARAANPGKEIPLDYFTLQNYSAQRNDNIVKNARVALGTDFGWTPVLMNEWDYCVNPVDGDICDKPNKFPDRYNGPNAWRALSWLWDSIERPDVSHVLLREKVLQDIDPDTGAYSYPWTQIPVLFLGSMSEFRRPTQGKVAGLPLVASGDDEQIKIIGWNESGAATTLSLSLTSVPATLVGQQVFVKKISQKIRETLCPGGQDVMSAGHEITCWQDAVAPVTIAGSGVELPSIPVLKDEVVMVFAGSAPEYGSTWFDDLYVHSRQHVLRDGTEQAPKGAGHYDPRTGSLTVGVAPGGQAAARVRIKNAPAQFAMSSRVAGQGGLPAPGAAAGVRVDYLGDDGKPLKSVFFRDQRWQGAVPWAKLDWPKGASFSEVVSDLCGGGCAGLSGTPVTIDVAKQAPVGWPASRLLDVGVVLAGAEGDAIYRVDLP